MGTAVARTAQDSRTVQAAPAAEERKGFLALLQKNEAMIAPFLRPGSSIEALAVKVAHVAADNPELVKCTPRSLVLAVAKIEGWGLEIGETAHIVPYNVKVKTPQGDQWETRAKAMQDYKGKILMMIRAGVIRDADAHAVYEKDYFDYSYGLNAKLEHRPVADPEARGKMIGAYGIFFLPFGRTKHLFLSTEEIEQVRQSKSKQWKQGECPPWYAIKTVIHRMAKLMPKDERLARVLALFEQENSDDEVLVGAAEEVASVPAPRAQRAIASVVPPDSTMATEAAPLPAGSGYGAEADGEDFPEAEREG